jgi:hypothetical protein
VRDAVTGCGHNVGVAEASEVVGTLLVRAWVHDHRLVARVTTTPDIADVAPVSMVVGSRRALNREVDQWLREMGYVESNEHLANPE